MGLVAAPNAQPTEENRPAASTSQRDETRQFIETVEAVVECARQEWCRNDDNMSNLFSSKHAIKIALYLFDS